jgi:hypothetical protein
MNRKTLHIPTMKLSSIPQKGQKCLLYMVGGIVKDAFFYGSKTVDVQKEMATVLCNQDGKIKIIDEQRRTWILTAKNSWEKEMNAELKRDDKLQLGFFEGKILSYQKISRDVSHHYEIKVQENITREQIKVNFIEGKAVDSKKLQEAS